MLLPGGQPFQSKFGRLCIVSKRATTWKHLDWSLTLQNAIEMHQVLPPQKKKQTFSIPTFLLIFHLIMENGFCWASSYFESHENGENAANAANGKMTKSGMAPPPRFAWLRMGNRKAVDRPIAGSTVDNHVPGSNIRRKILRQHLHQNSAWRRVYWTPAFLEDFPHSKAKFSGGSSIRTRAAGRQFESVIHLLLPRARRCFSIESPRHRDVGLPVQGSCWTVAKGFWPSPYLPISRKFTLFLPLDVTSHKGALYGIEA